MKRKRILAVASAGGHWVQLLRMRPAFEGHEVVYLSTNSGLAGQVAPCRLMVVRDASMWNKGALIIMALQVLGCVLRYCPDVVISTGAAPGFFALFFGKLIGAKTIWVDSIANAEEMSLAGGKVRRWADHWLSQWPDVASKAGAEYWGGVL